MSLPEGTKFGAYEITGQIGAGGMGEVYRATDSKLGREVAIKTLPAALASDKDRLARFKREAKLLAALNHPHIASAYSLDEHDGTPCKLFETAGFFSQLVGRAWDPDPSGERFLMIRDPGAAEAGGEK